MSLRSLSAPRSLQRASSFTSSSALYSKAKVPSLSDITPEGGKSFRLKQKEYKERVQAKSHSVAKAQSLAAPFSTAINSSDSTSSQDASSSAAKGEPEESEEKKALRIELEANAKKRGLIKTLLLGTDGGRMMDLEAKEAFSSGLVRGKYVHSIVFHEVKPDKVDEYVELVGSWYPWMASVPENKVNLVGSWRTEIGDCDTFVHIWEYQKYHGYHDSLHKIATHPEFPAFDKKLRTLITSKKSSIMQEFAFWPTKAPRQLGGIFELRSYTIKPGTFKTFSLYWEESVRTRLDIMEGVGAWFCQIGDLDTIHHLWQFPDLEERIKQREECWALPGWSDMIHNTMPLIDSQKSRILIPCSWSPVA